MKTDMRLNTSNLIAFAEMVRLIRLLHGKNVMMETGYLMTVALLIAKLNLTSLA